MDIKELSELESSYQNARTNRNLGAYVGIAGLIGLISEFIWGAVGSPVAMGVVLGGGLVYCCMCHDKVTKTLRTLDCECYTKFGKSYAQSQREIFNEKYPDKGN